MDFRNFGWIVALFSFAALSCGDAVPPPAEGAVSLGLFPFSGAPTGYACDAHSLTWALGNAPDSSTTGSVLVDGHDGATVSCTVAGGGSYSVAGKIEYKGSRFSISGTMNADGTGTAAVAFWDQPSNTNQADAACTLQLGAGNYAVESGAIWAGFTCSHLVATDDRGSWCASSGTIVFKSCGE